MIVEIIIFSIIGLAVILKLITVWLDHCRNYEQFGKDLPGD